MTDVADPEYEEPCASCSDMVAGDGETVAWADVRFCTIACKNRWLNAQRAF